MKGCTQDPSPLKHLKVPLLLILYKLAFFFSCFYYFSAIKPIPAISKFTGVSIYIKSFVVNRVQ